MNLFASDFLEEPGAREIPIIIKSGQRNSKNLRCLLVGHASEIPQFDQFGLNGILDAERVKHFMHGQQLDIRAWSGQLKFLNFHALETPPRDAQFVCAEHDLSECAASPQPQPQKNACYF